MSKGIVTSFRVEAATNGFTLNYCVKKKMPLQAGQTYANTDYNDVSKVFEEGNIAGLLAEIKSLCGVALEGADSEAEGGPVLGIEKKEY